MKFKNLPLPSSIPPVPKDSYINEDMGSIIDEIKESGAKNLGIISSLIFADFSKSQGSLKS